MRSSVIKERVHSRLETTPISTRQFQKGGGGVASFSLLFAHTVDQPISRPWKLQTIASHYNQNNWLNRL